MKILIISLINTWLPFFHPCLTQSPHIFLFSHLSPHRVVFKAIRSFAQHFLLLRNASHFHKYTLEKENSHKERKFCSNTSTGWLIFVLVTSDGVCGEQLLFSNDKNPRKLIDESSEVFRNPQSSPKIFLLLFLFRDSRSKVDKHTRSQSPFLHYSLRWMFLFHLFATFVFLSGCAVSVRVTQSHSIPRKQSQIPSELEIKKEKKITKERFA